MGILNVNPDSFFDGNKYKNEADWLRQTEKMLVEGADFIDIGGISSRPGSTVISENEEIGRVLPVIEILIKNFPEIIISVDTFRNQVAKTSLAEGASIINDISGGRWEPSIFETVSEAKSTMIIMHSRKAFEKMHESFVYEDLIKEIKMELNIQVNRAINSGLYSVILDPGFGFSKNIDQNFELLNKMHYFHELNLPVLAGISRKSMIWKSLQTNPENALNGTTALHMICLQKGARILRVHDVKEAKEAITLFTKTNNYG